MLSRAVVSQWSRVNGASDRIAGQAPSQVLSEEDVSVKEMTQRQREVLSFMRGFTDKHGAPPTVREIAERFRFTPRAAFDHLRALERKGMLLRRVTDKRASRTLVLAARRTSRSSARSRLAPPSSLRSSARISSPCDRSGWRPRAARCSLSASPGTA
jgi:hypothetical protein